MTRRLNVLICAHSVSPNKGSEPGMGWSYVKALAQHHDLHVITQAERFEPDIRQGLADNPQMTGHVHFSFVPRHQFSHIEKVYPPAYYWTYRAWHRDALRLARRLHERQAFDVVHQLNLVGFREPGYLWKLGLPFAWGPVGGLGAVPWQLLPSFGPAGLAFLGLKNILNACQTRLLLRPRRAARAAGPGLIAATSGIHDTMRRLWGVESTVLTEVGPVPSGNTPSERTPREPLRIVWSGLHEHRKALHLLLLALARVPSDVSWHLDILGSGPCTRRWQRLARKLGLAARCTWHGWLPKAEAHDVMIRTHLMVICSVWDLTSTVLMEGLSFGLPVICLDHCGFGDVITDACGARIPVTTTPEILSAIAGALSELAADEPRRRRMAAAARERAAEFSWESKARTLSTLYERLVADEDPHRS